MRIPRRVEGQERQAGNASQFEQGNGRWKDIRRERSKREERGRRR
jgi:hypothetical protein